MHGGRYVKHVKKEHKELTNPSPKNQSLNWRWSSALSKFAREVMVRPQQNTRCSLALLPKRHANGIPRIPTQSVPLSISQALQLSFVNISYNSV